ncbi:hypothetical protein BDZ94DRAFT_781328 [Collybia nuda]|uniref:Uncharacterized protein n=1 Tax=Collybia nuda TaxID=64659 RepID=A0A9P6CJ38_9AGAR|nr:hypothetical protein BDZ94DRAFT_781328 [Collybia nuda]
MAILFYFIAKYTMFVSLTGLTGSLFVQNSQVNCQALFTFNVIMRNTAILCSTASMMLRTIVLLKKNRLVTTLLSTLTLGQWVILYRATLNTTVRLQDDLDHFCNDASVEPLWLDVGLFYTIGLDLMVFIFMAIALFHEHYNSNRSTLWKKLYHDGIWYVVISVTANTIPAVLNVLNLNAPMNNIAIIPAATITSIASCRFVLSLLKHGKLNTPRFDTLPNTVVSDRTVTPIQVEGQTTNMEAIALEVMNPAGTSTSSAGGSRLHADMEATIGSVPKLGPYRVFEG